jgi:hypothetical protein
MGNSHYRCSCCSAVWSSRQVPSSLVTGAFGTHDPPPAPTQPADPGSDHGYPLDCDEPDHCHPFVQKAVLATIAQHPARSVLIPEASPRSPSAELPFIRGAFYHWHLLDIKAIGPVSRRVPETFDHSPCPFAAARRQSANRRPGVSSG